MKPQDVVGQIDRLFSIKNTEIYEKESGLNYNANTLVKKIGFCVNLTLSTVEDAKRQGVDMMITHHDAWEELYEMKENCLNKLKEYSISHYFNHLPLDDASFGTNDSLVNGLGLTMIEKILAWEGYHFGRIAECKESLPLTQFVNIVEDTLKEKVRFWTFNDSLIKRVGLVCGNGAPTECLKEVNEHRCDVYITGESDLNLIEYAQFTQINLIVASHTSTEILGMMNFMDVLGKNLQDIEIVRLQEGSW